MFFAVTTDPNLKLEYPLSCYKINNFFVWLDSGWQVKDNLAYKGYVLNKNISEKVEIKDFSEETGNYVILDLDSEHVLHTDGSRSFPLYYNDKTVTNIELDKTNAVWFDAGVQYCNNQWQYISNPHRRLVFDETQPCYTTNEVVDFVCEYMVKYCKGMPDNLPILVAKTGGVDTTLIQSALDYCNIQYSLVRETDFLKSSLWGYRQLYQSDSAHLQITGFCGDEILLRNPLYCHWLLQPFNTDLIAQFAKNKDAYMSGFFNQSYKKKITNCSEKFTNRKQAIEHTYDVVINDFQMWHYNQTITFTPFRNKDLLNYVLYADQDAILSQVIHGDISLKVIERLNKNNLKNVNRYKNNVSPIQA